MSDPAGRHDLVERLRRVSPSTLGHLRDNGLIAGLEPIVRPLRMAGVAATLKATEYGAPGLVELAEASGPGTVIVISRPAGSRRTNFGGVVATRLVRLGITGVVVDGRVTDYEQLVELGLPVYHRGLTPIVGRRTAEPAVTGVPLTVDGVVINPGDYVFGDSDGIGVLTPYEAPGVVELLEEAERRERETLGSLGVEADSAHRVLLSNFSN